MKEKGLLWKLPVLTFKDFGKMGPAFGFGAGCGIGFGVGLLGRVGICPGISGLQVSFGFGAGCGVGLGFGYGIGRGIAQDEYRRYSNIGNPFPSSGNIIYEYPQGRLLPEYNREIQIPTNLFHAKRQDDITAIMDDLVINTKRILRATSKEIEKWSR